MQQAHTTIAGVNTHGETEEVVQAMKAARAAKSMDPAAVFGPRFERITRQRPTWSVGTKMPTPTDAATAIKMAGLNFQVEKVQPLITFQGAIVEHETFSLVKSNPDGGAAKHLGYVGKDYRVIQNADIARVLDESGLTAAWPVTAAGETPDGKKLFIELDAGLHYVKDEPVYGTVLLTEGKDGGAGLRAQYLAIRQVCTNGLTAPMKEAGLSFFLTHQGDITAALELQADVITRLRATEDQLFKKFQKMAEVSVTAKQARKIFEAAIPAWEHPNVATARLLGDKIADLDEAKRRKIQEAQGTTETFARLRAQRIAALELQYEHINDEFAAIAGTAWAAYNAVTEVADWREASSVRENVDASALFGGRREEKMRAFTAALAVASAPVRSR